MFKTFTVVAILAPGTAYADNLTPDQTGVINKTAPFVVDAFPTSVNDQITDVVSLSSDDNHEIGACEDEDLLDCGIDCEGTEEEGADDHGCASDSQGAVAVPEE